MKDTTIVEWYKDESKIDLFNSRNPTISCEYCETPEEDTDYSSQDPRIILHPNNSITIEEVKGEDVGTYLCKVRTGLSEPLGMRVMLRCVIKFHIYINHAEMFVLIT